MGIYDGPGAGRPELLLDRRCRRIGPYATFSTTVGGLKMARTKGQGNPRWTRDETILALDLYFELDGNVPPNSDDRIVRLSEFLQSLPLHPHARRRDTFRNPAGVAFKLNNLRNVATGRGLGNVSALDREIWEEFGDKKALVQQLAGAIRSEIATEGRAAAPASPEDEFYEGRLLTQIHKRRERDPRIRNRFLDSRRSKNALACDLCGCKSCLRDPRYEDALFEVHHLVPLAELGARRTVLSDLALLCANCHRLIHRAISIEGRWLTLEEYKKAVA